MPTTPVPPAPMLAIAAALPADSTAYCMEPKWDGIRALARCGPRVELFSRNANRLQSFPDITEALSTVLAGRAAILDGELVALDKRARPCFELIQRRLRATRPAAHLIAAVPALYIAFDVLYLDGADVTRRPYLQRRDLLESLRLDTAPLITSPSWTDISADVVLDVVRDMGLEGLIVKAGSIHLPARPAIGRVDQIRCPATQPDDRRRLDRRRRPPRRRRRLTAARRAQPSRRAGVQRPRRNRADRPCTPHTGRCTHRDRLPRRHRSSAPPWFRLPGESTG